jgi:hypothetical protein
MSLQLSLATGRRLLILVIIAPHLAAGILSFEWFPFSSYPMYSTLRREPVYKFFMLRAFRHVEVNGQIQREDLEFRSRQYLWPFDEPGLLQSFAGLIQARRMDDVSAGLQEIAHRYRVRRQLYPDRNFPEIHGLSLYRAQWRALPGAPNVHEPESLELIREVVLP